MVIPRTCRAHKQDGTACGAAPLQDGELCYMHSPEHAEEMQQARRLGGQRRRRESTLAGAYEVDALDTVAGIRRVLEIVTFDGLGMEGNSVARGRLLIAASQALTKLLETGELEQRVAELESVVKPRIASEKKRKR